MVKLLQVANNQGFTLIEVLVVLSIKILLISLFISVTYDELTQTKMDAFFDELKSDVDLVQSHNYQTDHYYELIFNKNSYKLTKNKSNKFINIKEESDNDGVIVKIHN